MSLRYDSLDAAVREQMVSELERDIGNGKLYISPRLTEDGVKQWPNILREACVKHDDSWLAATLRERRLLRAQEERKKPKGGFTMANVPVTAPDTLAEGEFNRLYCRGLCVVVSGGEVEVYRGKDVQSPRAESEVKIGKKYPAAKLLEDLRSSQGVEPALGLPPGPNSGLTIRKPK